MPMTRIARCCCGSLRAETSGEPAGVAVCHCIECQRRTGSAFGANTYFRKEQVRVEGPSTVYQRDGQEGRKVRIHFCPQCGSSVYWEADFLPRHIGIAYGAFADLSLAPPTLSAWEQSRHAWIAFDQPIEGFQQAVVRASGD
jgi:hypothetical protein